MGLRSHGGQIFGTRPTVACRSFLYIIYRNEQNHSLSSVNKLDQSLTIALFYFTDYVEKSRIKNTEQKLRMGVNGIMTKRHDLCLVWQSRCNGQLADMQNQKIPLVRHMPTINF